MRIPKTIQYCAPQDVLKLLERDGLGWGHDLQCGTFTAQTKPKPKEAK
ncbi:MAG: hypothetical protein AAFQ64_02095 [Pseudomonadota bacterium]